MSLGETPSVTTRRISPFSDLDFYPRRGCGLQPQVVPQSGKQPGGRRPVCSATSTRLWPVTRSWGQPAGTLSGFIAITRLTQGCSFLATLGFVPKSLWDLQRSSRAFVDSYSSGHGNYSCIASG